MGRNVRVGRLEIDIVAAKGTLCVFVEVRARSSAEYGHPAETVSRVKRNRIRQAATGWLRSRKAANGFVEARFDVAALLKNEHGRFEIEYYENAF